MKKSIISFAVAAMALISPAIISAADNTDTKTTPACPRSECVANCNTNVNHRRPCPFDGINLTDAQKKQIEALSCPAANKDRKTQKEELRKQRRQQRADHLAQIKKILTPEQYIQFLENNYLDKSPRHHKFARDGKGKRPRDGKGKRPRDGKGKRPSDSKSK